MENKVPEESPAQEDHLGLQVYLVMGFLEPKGNRGHRDIQELGNPVCLGCQESRAPWECLGQKVKLDPKGRLDPWAYQAHRDLQALMDFQALESQVGQGYQGSQVSRVSEDPKDPQALQVSKVLKEKGVSGCPVCPA